MNPIKLEGLVAAVHTPFRADGSLNLDIVEKQAQHLQRNGIAGVGLGIRCVNQFVTVAMF